MFVRQLLDLDNPPLIRNLLSSHVEFDVSELHINRHNVKGPLDILS